MLVAFLPGFISLKLYRFMEQRETSAGEAIIDVVGFSLLNAAALFWPIYIAATHLAISSPDYAIVIRNAFWVCFVGPIVWPVLFRLAKRFGLRGGWLLGEQKTAFDAYFSTKQPCWVIVHIQDSAPVAGYFGASSYASAHPHSGDFYLEELWTLSPTGAFEERIPNSKGALFRRSDYLWLEFFWDRPPEEDVENGTT